MGIALGYKLLGSTPGPAPSGGRRLKRGGSSLGATVSQTPQGSIGFTLGEANDKIKILMYMGISITLINVFSNLYVYYECREGGCKGDDQTMIRSLVSAQINIIIIGIIAIVMFIIDSRK